MFIHFVLDSFLTYVWISGVEASLKTYKFLLDTQAGLTNLTAGIGNLNGTGLESVQNLITQIQPVLLSLEDTIDQFGADFSVQNVVNQTSEYVHPPFPHVLMTSQSLTSWHRLNQHPKDPRARRGRERERAEAEGPEQGEPARGERPHRCGADVHEPARGGRAGGERQRERAAGYPA